MQFTTNRRMFAKTAAAVGASIATGLKMAGDARAQATRGGMQLAQGVRGTEEGAAAGGAGSGGGDVPLAPPDKQPPNLEVPRPVQRKAGWAIVGLGELALSQIMPAFGSCRLSRPTALVSGHRDKAEKVASVYGVPSNAIYDYAGFDRLADNADVDVVYIVLPNSMHAEFTIRALEAGKHVLCEKPMAVTPDDCQRMIDAARMADRKLMIAYRLHYEPLNRRVMELCARDELGDVIGFVSSNCQSVKAPNIRLSSELGGGPVSDIGIYEINAARYCFNEEPVEVAAIAQQPAGDPRFREVPAGVAFTLRFSSGGVASCYCSFDSGVSRSYRVLCKRGFIDMDPAYSYSGLKLSVSRGEKEKGTAENAELDIEQVDQFAAEMDHFSDCVLSNKTPRTPGEEGLADVRIIRAIDEAIRTGTTVPIGS